MKDRSEVLAPATVGLVYGSVAAVMRAAVDDRVITRNPCVRVKLPKPDRKRVVPLEVEQVDRLTQALPKRYRALVTLAAGTGLRQGECLGLRVDRCDFLCQTIRVDR